MDKRVFHEAGLTDKETGVYLALLELGQASVGNILEKTAVSSSKLYEIIGRLEKKGLASEVQKGKIRYFSAAPPQRLLDYLEEKKKGLAHLSGEMKKLLPQLEAIQAATSLPEARVYVGYNGLRTGFDTILQTLKSGEGYVGFIATVQEQNDPVTVNLFAQYHKRRAEKRISAKLIAGEEMRPIMKKTPFTGYKKFQIRYVAQETLSNILIFKDYLWVYTGVGTPVGFLLTSRPLADMFKRFFRASWKVSKP